MTIRLTRAVIQSTIRVRPTEKILGNLPWILDRDREADWFRAENYYPFYVAAAALVRPSRVCEIGVRLGYSLVSMFRGHSEITHIKGIDAERMILGSQTKALKNLRAAGYQGELLLPLADSHEVMFPPSFYDLIHVDAEHDEDDARMDINKAWRALKPGGTMLVDDVDFPAVRDAVGSMKGALPGIAGEFYYPTFRGCWVAQKGPLSP